MSNITYGTWNGDNESSIKDRIKIALSLGYTHFDTAENYHTEADIMQALKECSMSRESIFLTTKIVDIVSLEYTYDSLLLHYPPLNTGSRENFKQSLYNIWKRMQVYIVDGTAKKLGVSNFYKNHLDILLEICHENNFILPHVNQIAIHLGNLELDYVPYIQNKGIIVCAHSSLGGLGAKFLLKNDLLKSISVRLGVTPAQVMISYLIKRNIKVIISSSNEIHIRENMQTIDITEDDIFKINELNLGYGPMIEKAELSYEDNLTLI